jgi:type IV pilus assembly protein PilM
MASSNAAWGIEIGSFAIKAIRLERLGDDVRVTDFAYVPHKKPLSTPDTDVEEMTRITLGQLMSEKNFEGETIAMSVEGRSSFARFAKLPPVEAKKIPDIVKFEAVQQIPFPIDEVEWDSKAFISDDSPETEVGIFAIKRDELQRRLALWAEHGLHPEIVTVGPVALYNAVHFDLAGKAQKGPLVILDIGTSASDLVVADGEKCWIRTFPIGGSDFTEAISTTFKLGYSKAERLKRESATSKYAKQIMSAMRPVFSDLLTDVERSLKHYESQHRGIELNRVLGVGSTFKIPGLRKFLGQQLQVGVARLDEFRRIRVEGREAASFASNTVNMTTAYGLALQGVGLAEIEVNLNPTHVMREQMWHRKTKWFVAAACVAAAAGAMLFVRPVLDNAAYASDAVAAARELDDVVRDGKKHKNELTQLSSGNTIGFSATNIERLLDDREVWPHLISDAVSSVAAAGPQPVLLGSDPEQIKRISPGERTLALLEDLQGNYVVDGADRYIEVEMQIAFSHTNKRGFLNETVGKWLREHAVRPGVPYIIDVDSISTNQALLQTVKVTESGTEAQRPAGAGRKPGGQAPGRNRGNSSRGNARGGGGGGMGAPGMGAPGGGGGGQQPGRRQHSGDKVDPGAGPAGGSGIGSQSGEYVGDPPGGSGFGNSGFGSSGTGDGWRNSDRKGDDEDLSLDLATAAPIPGKPSLYSVGDEYHLGRVTFRIKFVDPNAAPPKG